MIHYIADLILLGIITYLWTRITQLSQAVGVLSQYIQSRDDITLENMVNTVLIDDYDWSSSDFWKDDE